MEYIQGALQRTISQCWQQRQICLPAITSQPSLKPYAYVAYERDDLPDSTGAALFYADSEEELAARAHISRRTICYMLEREARGDTNSVPYLPFIIKKVYLV